MIKAHLSAPTAKTALFAVLAVACVAASGNEPSWAGKFQRQHPRRAEVLHRDNHLSNRINNNYGHLGGHYGHLASQDNQIHRQEQRDARNNGGYITRGQKGQLNREENSLSRETYFDNKNNKFVQNHPRRSQVLGRDANLNYALNKDEGKLGGNYGQLEKEDHSIARQEQQDARQNGGYITKQQRQQLNQEETGLRQQVQQDYK
jgi:hypothetical protein